MDFREQFQLAFKDDISENTEKIIQEDDSEDIEKIRKAKIKIKQILPTKFGKEVIFFKDQDAIKAAELVQTKKIDGKSIFIDS